MIEPEIDHVEHAVSAYGGGDSFVQALEAQTLSSGNFPCYGPCARLFGGFRPICLQGNLHDFERVNQDSFNGACAQTSQRKRLE